MGNSSISKSFALRDAGQILARKRAIDQRINNLNIAYENASVEECPYLLGKISGLHENRSVNHRKLVNNLVETRNEITAAIDFNDEQAFLKGYLKGIETILEIDREVFEEQTDFIFFIYSEQQSFLDKYLLGFRAITAFSELCGTGLQYCLSSNAEDLSEKINTYQGTNEYIVVVIYDSASLPSVETMQKLSGNRQDCIYLHKDSGEENIEKLIYRFLEKTSA